MNRKELLNVLKNLNKFVIGKNSLSILTYIEFEDGFINGFFNMSTFIKIKFDDIKKSDKIYYLDDLIKILSVVNNEEIEINDNILIAGKREFDLLTIPHEKFPPYEFKISTLLNKISITGNELKLLLNTVSLNENRRFINAICIDFFEDYYNCISTDGKQLTEIEKNEGEFKLLGQKLIKSNSLLILNKIIKDDDIINITCYDNNYIIESKDIFIYTIYENGTFPPYKNIIPDIENYEKIEFKKSDLLEEFKIFNKMLKKGDSLKVECIINNNKMNLLCNYGMDQNIKSNIDINTDIKDIKFALNLNSYNNFFNTINKDKGIIYIKDQDSILISKYDNINYIAMPMTY